MALGVPYGQQRVHLLPKETEQDTKANGPTARNVSQCYPKLRTGVAFCDALCRAADVFHSLQDCGEVADVNLPMMLIENLNKAAHVGALELLGKVDVHVDVGHSLLTTVGPIQNGDGIANVLNTHLVDVDVAVVSRILNIAEPLLT